MTWLKGKSKDLLYYGVFSPQDGNKNVVFRALEKKSKMFIMMEEILFQLLWKPRRDTVEHPQISAK